MHPHPIRRPRHPRRHASDNHNPLPDRGSAYLQQCPVDLLHHVIRVRDLRHEEGLDAPDERQLAANARIRRERQQVRHIAPPGDEPGRKAGLGEGNQVGGVYIVCDAHRRMGQRTCRGPHPLVLQRRERTERLLLDVLDDPRHGLHHEGRVLTDTRLPREHERVSAIEDRIRDVTDLCSRWPGRRDHRIEHLGGHDDGLSCLTAHLDRPLLNERDHLQRQLHPKITAGHHDTIERFDDFREIVDGLRLLDLGQDRDTDSLLLHDRVHIIDIACISDERKRDHVGADPKPPAQVFNILFRHRRNAHGDTGQVEALVVRDSSTLDHPGDDPRAIDAENLQGNAAIVDEDCIAHGHVAGEPLVGRRDHVLIARDVVGRDDELVSHIEEDRARGKSPESDLGALEVDENANPTAGFVRCLAYGGIHGCMVSMVTVRQIETGDVHPGIHEAADGLDGTR